ncbi:hypothetical protein F5Y06DRAFT_120916 [Hypoxylon sp. FL0890]|nr:hypothetical protein F5Y06DRAFT_120916 [Hypoxylon sp. FL0890]
MAKEERRVLPRLRLKDVRIFSPLVVPFGVFSSADLISILVGNLEGFGIFPCIFPGWVLCVVSRKQVHYMSLMVFLDLSLPYTLHPFNSTSEEDSYLEISPALGCKRTAYLTCQF